MENDGIEKEYITMSSSLTAIFCVILASLFIIFYMMTLVDNRTSHNVREAVNQGFRRGLKMYSQTYDKSSDAMASLGEGYIIEEDGKFNMDSNPVVINPTTASRNFREILGANMVLTDAEVKKLNINFIQVYSKFTFVSGKPQATYTFSIYDIKGNLVYTDPGNLPDLKSVQERIEGQIGDVSIDFVTGINASLHQVVDYGRVDNNLQTASTYNTFICIGKEIPLKLRFGLTGKKTVDILELQSYAVSR